MEQWVYLALSAWAVSAVIMLILWVFYLVKGDPAIVDIGWGSSIGVATGWLFLQQPESAPRHWVLLFCVALWSLRISALLVGRMLKGQKDRRYIELSASWKTNLPRKYFLFFQAQALSVGLLLIPVALCFSAGTVWTWLDSLGVAFFALGLAGETLADWQMARFREDTAKAQEVCRVGLWRYSRHPNYFFEWIIWVSYAVMGMSHPMGLFGWISPLVILTSILKITGIPPTEERLLASKGDAYRAYQRTTSAFIPMPPKE